ncbi:MAG TPA: hypothetical protein VGM88_02230 [Kofleriaceae bacterium]|jgi:hypothetical protein
MRCAAAIALLAACHTQEPAARDLALAALGSGVDAVIAADGKALALPRAKAVLTALAARWPARFGCIVDAAIASDAAAAGIDAHGNAIVAILTHATVKCPALSQVATHLWLASFGGAAPQGGGTVLDDPRFARALPYLRETPIAAAIAGSQFTAIAAAKPEPFEAWLTVDATGDTRAAAEAALTAARNRLSADHVTADLVPLLAIDHSGDQLIVRTQAGNAPAYAPEVLSAAAIRVLDALGASDPTPSDAPLVLADVTAPNTGAAFADLSDGSLSPAIQRGDVVGLRLDHDAQALNLKRGDILVAIDGHRVVTREQVTAAVAAAGPHEFLVRRGAREASFHVRVE